MTAPRVKASPVSRRTVKAPKPALINCSGYDVYDAFVGGFNFDQTGGPDYVAGLFLLERDERLDPGNTTGGATLFKNLNDLPSTGMIAGVDLGVDANSESINILTGLKSTLDGSNVYFQNQVFNNGTETKNDIYIVPPAGLNDADRYNDSNSWLQIGYWNELYTDNVDLLSDNLDASTPDAAAFPLAWANILKPVSDFNYLTGVFSTNQGGSEILGAIDPGAGFEEEFWDIEMNFLLDFASGNIDDGSFRFGDWCGECSDDFWFEGDLSGNIDQIATSGFVVDNVKYVEGYYEPYEYDFLAGDTANITGALTGEPASSGPSMVGVFYFNSPDAEAVGSYFVPGFVEDRLTYDQLQGIQNSIGLLIDDTGAGRIESLFSDSSASNSPLLGFIDDVTNQQYFSLEEYSDAFWNNDIDSIYVENGTGSINSQSNSDFNAGWGYWATGADALIDKLDGDAAPDTGADAFLSNPLYWLSAEPTDIQNLTGAFSYSGVAAGDFIGMDSAGNAINSLDMGFDVNFGAGSNHISNGFLNAVTSAGNWNVTGFSGDVYGARAVMNGITGSYDFDDSGSPVSNAITDANIQGVFVGTRANNGFASGFTLTDGITGLSGAALINSRAPLALD